MAAILKIVLRRIFCLFSYCILDFDERRLSYRLHLLLLIFFGQQYYYYYVVFIISLRLSFSFFSHFVPCTTYFYNNEELVWVSNIYKICGQYTLQSIFSSFNTLLPMYTFYIYSLIYCTSRILWHAVFYFTLSLSIIVISIRAKMYKHWNT